MSKLKLNLLSIFEAIEKIERYSSEFINADAFYKDEKSFDASMMQFIVIGEAIDRIENNFKQKNDKIQWQKIKDFRNIVAHDYFGIDADEIWEIIQTKIKPLKKQIFELSENVK